MSAQRAASFTVASRCWIILKQGGAARQGVSAMVNLATKKFDIRKLVFSRLLAATAVLSGCGGSSESEFQQIVRQSNCVTADQVYADYQNNEVAAQQKYQGRVNRICGVVDEIELNLFNQPVISLDASLLGSVSIGGIDVRRQNIWH